jgi:TorA maturation chaperone TorD
MPNCFQLTRKGDTHPSPLVLIDDLICEHFGVEPDPVTYFNSWYDSIGFKLAMGKSLTEIVNYYHREYELCKGNDPSDYWQTQLKIAQWLEENYIPDTWAEIGRR